MARYQSQSAEEKKAVATSAGFARSVGATNVSASTRYLFVYDNASAASGTLLLPPIKISPGDTVNVDFEPTMLPYTAGLYLAASSSQTSYAASGANDMSFHVDVAEAEVVVIAAKREAT